MTRKPAIAPIIALILALSVTACATVETSTRSAPFDAAPLHGWAEGEDLRRAYATGMPIPEAVARP